MLRLTQPLFDDLEAVWKRSRAEQLVALLLLKVGMGEAERHT